MLLEKKSALFGMFSRDFYFTAGVITVIFIGGLWLTNWIPFMHSKEATLFLAFENDGKGRMFTGEVVDGMTILDALIVSSEAGQIKFAYHIDQNNKLIIDGIDGYTPASDKEAVFYLNRVRFGAEYIGKVAIRAGDSIEVRLE